MTRDFFTRSLGNILKGALGGLASGVLIWVIHVLQISSGSSSTSSSLMLVIVYSVLLGAAIGLGVTRPQVRNWKHGLLILICAWLMCLFFVPLILMIFLTFSFSLPSLLLLAGGALLLIALIMVFAQFILPYP